MFDRLRQLFSGTTEPLRIVDEELGTANDPPTPKSRDRYRIELDRTRQVLRLECDEVLDFRQAVSKSPADPADDEPPFVSGSMLTQKAKQFDDGLYAAVELAAQNGAGSFRGKEWLLKNLLERLADLPAGEESDILFGAAYFGKIAAAVPARLKLRGRLKAWSFLSDELRSKPISFYTWSNDLRGIFRQDRLLQSEMSDAKIIAMIKHALEETEGASETYDEYIGLISGLTNRLVKPDLRSGTPDGGRFFPPSRTHETDLVKKLYGDGSVPDDFNLANELIRAVRNGSVSLKPAPDSGWYDLQTWALESLVAPDDAPESARLKLNPDYRDQLEELLRGALALARETHIKQVETLAVLMSAGSWGARDPGDPVVFVRPQLSVEPLYTHYLRRAIGYGHVRLLLRDVFGAEGLRSLNRMTPDGPVSLNMDQELDEMAGLFFGASVVASRELGIGAAERIEMQQFALLEVGADAGLAAELGSGEGAEHDAALFERWVESSSEDPDLERDVRMMVPLFHDRIRGKTKVWVFLGWSRRPLTVTFERRPGYKIYDCEGGRVEDSVEVVWKPLVRSVSYPVTAEIWVTKLLDRRQFRALCDRHSYPHEILEALK